MNTFKVDLNTLKVLMCYSRFLDKSLQRGLLLWDECIDYVIEKTEGCDIPGIENLAEGELNIGNELFKIKNRGYFYQFMMPIKKIRFKLFGIVSKSDFELIIRCANIIILLKSGTLSHIHLDERRKLRLFFWYFCGEFDFLFNAVSGIKGIEYFKNPDFLTKNKFKDVYIRALK